MFRIILPILATTGFAIGMAIPMPKPAKSYDFVWYQTGQKYVVDTGLSLDDCERRVPEMRGLGFHMDCERR